MTMEQLWHRVPGGTAVAALGMSRALLRRPEIDLVGVAALHRKDPPPAWASPIPVKQLRLPRLALYESWHRLRQPSVERACGPVDVIHATSIAVPPRSAPLVVTIHDLAFLDHPGMFTARGRSFFHRGLELALADADLVICPSHATEKDCLRAGFAADRVRVVPLGVEIVPAGEDAVAQARRRYGLERDYIIWSGTIEPRKNLERLLRAYDALHLEVDLVMVGPEGWNEALSGIASGARPPKLLGFVPTADLRALYAGARALAWPSLKEGFGFPVLEAMAQGTPVVTSRGTSTEEIAGDASLLVDPTSTAEITAALREVLCDPERARVMSEAGVKRAATFSWDRTAAALTDAYGEVR
jgi:glycosyltransferase involved in cell wall biosynthesis